MSPILWSARGPAFACSSAALGQISAPRLPYTASHPGSAMAPSPIGRRKISPTSRLREARSGSVGRATSAGVAVEGSADDAAHDRRRPPDRQLRQPLRGARRRRRPSVNKLCLVRAPRAFEAPQALVLELAATEVEPL